jgi:hypothetical protein
VNGFNEPVWRAVVLEQDWAVFFCAHAKDVKALPRNEKRR